jgi:hypothetical protein
MYGVGLFIFYLRDHKIFVLIFWLRIGNRCVRKYMWNHGIIASELHECSGVDRTVCCGWAVFATTTIASYEALPLPLLMSILLCSSPPFPMLA